MVNERYEKIGILTSMSIPKHNYSINLKYSAVDGLENN